MRANHPAYFACLALAMCVGACGKTGNKNTATASGGLDARGPIPPCLGRVDATNPNLVLMALPGTAAETRFQGSSVTATVSLAGASLADPTQAQTYVELTVDGATPTRKLVGATGNTDVTVTVSSGLHTARLTKVTEATFGTLNFIGFTTDGTLQPTVLPERKIEFIGDSLSCGYGVLGTDPNCSGENPQFEEVRAAYDVVAATALQADYSIIAWSGKGVYKNRSLDANDSVTIPALYGLIDPTSSSSAYTFPSAPSDQPGVVVINLGTNDFAHFANQPVSALPDQAGYTAALQGLATTVRGRYPSAYIILAIGPIVSNFPEAGKVANQLDTWRSYVQAAVASLADSKVSFFEFTALVDATQKGCSSHPNIAASAVMGAALQAKISELTGWK